MRPPPVTIQPYVKSNCWGWAVPQTDAWVFFGNIGGNGGRFGWDFSDPALTDPGCPHPVIQFTYGTNNVAPPDENARQSPQPGKMEPGRRVRPVPFLELR